MTAGYLRMGLAVLWMGVLGAAYAAPKLPYTYSYIGDPNISPSITPSNKAATPSWVVMGGGPDVDQAFAWMIKRAGVVPGSGGRFVVIRATGTGAYNDYIYENDASLTQWPTVVGGKRLGLSAVETLVIPSVNAANDPQVNKIVARADAVFIAGGDQKDYITYWKGTLLNNTLNTPMANKVPVGGTSAGLAILGQFDFAALKGTVTSAQALANPFNKYMTIDPGQTLQTSSVSFPSGGFITPHPLFNTIVDAHLDERDRMGRLVAFLSRLVGPVAATSGGCSGGILMSSSSMPSPANPAYSDLVARGLGVGVETALLVEGDGVTTDVIAKRVSNPDTTTWSAAYFLWPQYDPTQCAAGKPLAIDRVLVTRVDANQPVFNLSTWTGGSMTYTLKVLDGALSSTAAGGAVYGPAP